MQLNFSAFFKKMPFLVVSLFLINILLLKYLQPSITNPYRVDGFGAQFQTIIYAAIYAELNNKPFVYTPFDSMEHNYNNDAKFIEKKENLINFIGNFNLSDNNSKINRLETGQYIRFFEKNLDKCYNSKTLKKIKNVFRANKPQDFFANNKFNIAVHIRRPNSHDNRLAGADVPDQKFLDIINNLKQKYADQDYLIHIYSQGNADNFKMYGNERVALHLNESIENTFTGLVYADVLVLSPSSFSYTAGLISDGKVYYMPFWHPPLRGWEIL